MFFPPHLEPRCYHASVSRPTELGKLLKSLLKTAGITQAEFAQRIGVEGKYPSHFVTGRRLFPVEKLPAAARALKLAPGSPQRAALERAVYLSHAPEEVRHLVDTLEAQLIKLRQDRDSQQAILRKIVAKVPALADQFSDLSGDG